MFKPDGSFYTRDGGGEVSYEVSYDNHEVYDDNNIRFLRVTLRLSRIVMTLRR